MIFLLLVVIKRQLILNGERHIFEVAVFTMDICIELNECTKCWDMVS